MKTLIVANWKCNPTSFKGAKLLFGSVQRGIKKIQKVEVVICPPFPYLSELKSQKSKIKFGAQDCFWEEKGAFTGEVSPLMLKDLGCQYVIIGHSERRRYFAETDEMINKKIKAVLKAKLKPIFCLGETFEEKNRGRTSVKLRIQIEKGLLKISKKEMKNLVIAYEPIWAIGTGKPCHPNEAQIMGLLIKKIIGNLYTKTLAKNLPILYGGSVNSKNARDYIKEAGLSGLLVGRASLDPPEEFVKIVKNISQI